MRSALPSISRSRAKCQTASRLRCFSHESLALSRIINPEGNFERQSVGLRIQRWYASPSKFEARSRLHERGLTLPSRGRPTSGFASCRPPLMSNVRAHASPSLPKLSRAHVHRRVRAGRRMVMSLLRRYLACPKTERRTGRAVSCHAARRRHAGLIVRTSSVGLSIV